jgi:hypothetical protein
MTGWRRRGHWFVCGVAALAVTVSPARGAADAVPGGLRQIAMRVRSGLVTGQVSWVVDESTSSEALRGRIEYRPDADRSCSCSKIRFVQVARVARSGGRDYDWEMGETHRNLLRTIGDPDSRVRSGYFVDHKAVGCAAGRPCSPYFRDSWANPDESRDGFQRGTQTAPASLIDYPYGWDTIEQVALESCARCVDSGEFLGCAEWGATWPGRGPREIQPIQIHQAPSETFRAALRQFEAFYARPAQTNVLTALTIQQK